MARAHRKDLCMNRNFPQWRSIKTRVTLFTLAIFLISIWALAIATSHMLRADMQRLLGAQQLSTAAVLAADLENELASRLKDLEAIAGAVNPLLFDDPRQLQGFIERRPIFLSRFNAGAFVTRSDGRAIVDVPPTAGRSGLNFMDNDSIATALRQGKAAIGRPHMDRTRKTPVFHMAVPIRDAQGKVLGALVGMIDLGQPSFLDRITDNRFGKTGGYLIVAPQHRLIVSASDKRRVMELAPPPGMVPAIDRFLDGDEGTAVFINPVGVEVLQSVKRVPVAGWYLAVTLSTAEAFAPIHDMQQRMLLAALLLSILAGGLTWWMLRRELSPMLATLNTLTNLSNANQHPQPLPIESQDEIGQLIGGFNRLLEILAQREAALRTSTDRLNEAQRISHIGSWTLDLESGKLDWSDEIYRLFALDPAHFEATYEAFLNAIHPADREAVNRAYTASLESRAPYEITHRLLMPDGSIKWVVERCNSEFDASGKPLRSVGTVQDITTHKLISDALGQAKQQMDSIVSNIPAMVFLKRASDLRFELFNRAGEELLGYSTQDLLGKNDYDLFPREQADFFLAQDRLVLASENVVEIPEERITTASGEVRYLYTRKVALRDAQNVPTHLLGISVDITERKKAEAELRIAAVAFESQEGMMITDAQGVILRVNQAFTELTGYSAEEAVGQTPHMLQSGRHSDDFYHAMWETIRVTGGWSGEVWDMNKNGEVYPKWLTISAVRDDAGAVTHYIGAQYDISERKQSEEKINQLAFYDQLTGLPNRTLLQDRLRQSITNCARSGVYGALLFLDLDKFKTLNDSLGHDMGDQLLRQVAMRLTHCVRAGDTVARLGGDEFVLVLGSLSSNAREAAQQIEVVGEKILAELNQPYLLGEVVYHSTPSIGATLFHGDNTEIEVLLKQGDLAMYKAKAAGRNTLRFFDPDMEIDVMKRATLENDLHEAIEKQQFILHYQAQMTNGRLSGAEVLVRWQHPQRGMIPPAEFIPLAEETGLILSLGHWVLETACKQLALWAAHPELAHLTIALNISARQFHKPDFVDQVMTVIQQTGANSLRLKLELTESLLVDNVDDIIVKMNALKTFGVGFALDDFGTGFSSLNYLKRLPLDQMKIDQSFVRDILEDANDAVIARTIVALAQSLGLGVIAEGVETEAQRDFLAGLDCHAYQGYYFSRPLPLEEFEEFARRI